MGLDGIGNNSTSDILWDQQNVDRIQFASKGGDAISASTGGSSSSQIEQDRTATQGLMRDTAVSQAFISLLKLPQLMAPNAFKGPGFIQRKLEQFVENMLNRLLGKVENIVQSADMKANEMDKAPDRETKKIDWTLSLGQTLDKTDEIAESSKDHPAFQLMGEISDTQARRLQRDIIYAVVFMTDRIAVDADHGFNGTYLQHGEQS